MKDKLISVIVPIYGAENYINDTLESLFNQTMLDGVEFILVNDCTPDKSMMNAKEVIDKYPALQEQIQIVNHEQNKGVATTRNSGLAVASGEYIIQVDADDYCELDMLEKMFKQTSEDIDIVVCDYIVDFPNRQKYVKQLSSDSGPQCVRELLNGILHGSTCNKLIKRSLFFDNSVFFVDGENMWEDLTLMIKIFFYAKNIKYLPMAFLHYRQVNPKSYTRKMSSKSSKDLFYSVENISSFFVANGVFNLFDKDLNYLKLSAKFQWLLNTEGMDKVDYLKLYPESDSQIMFHPHYPIYYKYSLLAYTKGYIRFSNFMVTLINFSKKLFS